MNSRDLLRLTFIMFSLLVFNCQMAESAEVFQPTYLFRGSVNITADSYFGKYPDDPVVEIPEGITDEEELKKWEAEKKHDEDIRRIFKLCNPTVPGVSQTINLEFYANPVPDLEVIINMNHKGLWGGSGTKDALNFPLMLNEIYARYYTNNAMYTLGRFKYKLGPLGLLDESSGGPKEGFMINTMVKDMWITSAYSRLLMSMYREYPYVSNYLLDEMVVTRLSKRIGEENLIGLNLIFNGFYDEKGLSLDYNGKIMGYKIIAEVGLIYPAWVYRDLFPDHAWPGGIISINVIENLEHILTVRLGAMSKGFISQYGAKGMYGMESSVKFNPNTGGLDIVYQRGISDDLIFGANLFITDFLDYEYQEKMNAKYDLRTAEVKLQKYLSEASNIRFSLAYLENKTFQYGKAEMSWNFDF